MSNGSEPKCPQCGAPLQENALAGLCPNCLMALNLKTETSFTGETEPAHPPLPPEEIAPHFPQLEILELLGRGGMGVVYKARQRTLNRLVALKLLAPERVGDPKFAERFAREAQALAALSHPNIVTIHDFGRAGGFFYLLMEFVDGVNLRQLLRARKFTPEEALAIVPPLCDALQFAHERGIVHRDIKPENLLLDKSGRVKIADFGIAKMLGVGNEGQTLEAASSGQATQNALGTPGYSAPEQLAAPQRVDNRSDIFSLGVVFYEMLTGELPGKTIELPSKKVQIDVRLDEVVLRALEKNPEQRYQSAGVLKTQIETIVATPALSRKAGEKPPPVPKPGPPKIPSPSPASPSSLRFSRTAIIGLIGLFISLISVGGGAIVTIFFRLPSMHGSPTWFLLLAGTSFLAAFMLGPVATTLLGWIAVGQIRRSAGKLCGMGLALFEGLLFPLLVANGAVIVFTLINIDNGLGRVLAVGTLLVVNFLAIRGIWRKVRPSLNGNPVDKPAPLRSRFSSAFRWAIAGLFIVFLISLIGILSFAHQNNATTSDRNALSPQTDLKVRYQVFEADADLVDRLVPSETRARGDEREKGLIYSGSPPNAVSQMAEISSRVLAALVKGRSTKPGMLLDRRKTVLMWPKLADGESYAKNDRVGGINGFEGARRNRGEVEIRVQYHVTHMIPGGISVSAEIFYQGDAAQSGGARAFFVPFSDANNTAKYLVVTFQAGSNADVPAITPDEPPASELVMKQTLPLDSGGQTELFDPESGSLIRPPNSPKLRQGLALLSKPGLVITRGTTKNETTLLGMNGYLVQNSDSGQWDNLQNIQALETIRRNSSTPGVMVGVTTIDPLPQTFLFKTASQRLGILQVTAYSNTPRRVMFRYKFFDDDLIKEMKPPAASAQELADRVKKVLETRDTNGFHALFDWREAPTNMDFYSATFESWKKLPADATNAHVLLGPLQATNVYQGSVPEWLPRPPDIIEMASVSNRLSPTAKGDMLGLLGATVTYLKNGSNVSWGFSTPYGRDAGGFYLAGYEEERIRVPKIKEKLLEVAVTTKSPTDFRGAFVYVENGEVITKKLGGNMNLKRQFHGDYVKYCAVTNLSKTGFIQLRIQSGTNTLFDSGPVTNRTPIIYQRDIDGLVFKPTSRASKELWSPTVGLDEKPDPARIRDLIKPLLDAGDFEAALQRQLWYFNHAAQYGESDALRLSFGIMNWPELGKRYPKAQAAMIEIRDRDARELLSGGGDLKLVMELQNLNNAMSEDGATVTLYKELMEKNPMLAGQCYFFMEELLVSRGEFQFCYDHMGDAQKKFDALRRTWERNHDLQQRVSDTEKKAISAINDSNQWHDLTRTRVAAPEVAETMKKKNEERFVDQTRRLIEILVGTGHKSDAEKIRDEAVTVLDDARLKTSVQDAETTIRQRSISTSSK